MHQIADFECVCVWRGGGQSFCFCLFHGNLTGGGGGYQMYQICLAKFEIGFYMFG